MKAFIVFLVATLLTCAILVGLITRKAQPTHDYIAELRSTTEARGLAFDITRSDGAADGDWCSWTARAWPGRAAYSGYEPSWFRCGSTRPEAAKRLLKSILTEPAIGRTTYAHDPSGDVHGGYGDSKP